jgi:flagellar FliL protein
MSPAETETDSDDIEGAGAEAPAGGRGKQILLLVVAVVFALVGGGSAAFFLGVFGGDEAPAVTAGETGGEGAAATAPAPPPVFYALPDLVVTLNASDRKTRYLKVHVMLELARAEDEAQIERMTPRILDYCQIFLRELRPEELRGSAAIVRMREEILKRINAAVAPVTVREVLFTDLFVE